MTTLPEGRLIKVEFELRLPIAATKEQVAEWVTFCIGGGSIQGDNPLSDHDLDYWVARPILTDTYLRGREERGPETPIPGGVSYAVRHIREPSR